MSPPEVKKAVSKKRKNHIAKDLRTPKYRKRVVENKRKNADPQDDYSSVDAWITGGQHG